MEFRNAARTGWDVWKPLSAGSILSPNGIRACVCTIMCLDGMPFPISVRVNFIWIMETMISVSRLLRNQLVVASGEFMNPSEVLTPEQIKRLDAARNSDKTVMIRTEDEVINKTGRLSKNKLVWHFKCNHASDVAFGASSAFIWDAARINLPDGKKSLAMSVYPLESATDSGWKRSTEFVKGCIEELFPPDGFLIRIPYAVNVAGPVSGMEYPGIVFCHASARQREFGVLRVMNSAIPGFR